MPSELIDQHSEQWHPLQEEPSQPEQDQLYEGTILDRVLDSPKLKSATTIEYKVEPYEGVELHPGHSIGFTIPESMKGRLVRDVILQHRKAEQHRVEGSKEYDPHGAYSRVELHDQDSDGWVGWHDPKGHSSDKYAEWRDASDPENEVLHDWLATVGKVKPDAVRVTAVGKDEHAVSQIHGVEVVFYPELEGVRYEEKVYTPGTEFIDIENGKLLPKYGGGSHTEGVYESAVALNHYDDTKFELAKSGGEGVELAEDHMTIELKAGQKLIQVEVAAGDTEHLDYVNPKTKRPTRLGWAKLWVGIQRAGDDSHVDWIIQRANVPPQGVLAGGPDLDRADIQEGDKLIIQSREDASYVMGWRLAYESAEGDYEATITSGPEKDKDPQQAKLGRWLTKVLKNSTVK